MSKSLITEREPETPVEAKTYDFSRFMFESMYMREYPNDKTRRSIGHKIRKLKNKRVIPMDAKVEGYNGKY